MHSGQAHRPPSATGRAWLFALLLLTLCSASAGAQNALYVEAGAGIGIPAFTDWARNRTIGPVAAIGLSGDFSQSIGWVARAEWARFVYKKSAVETTDFFYSEPPGEYLKVTISDVEGGAFTSFEGMAGIRAALHKGRDSDEYITGGLVFGGISQDEATALRTTETDSMASSATELYASDYGDWGIGATIRLMADFHFGGSVSIFGEFGYQIMLTPGDSVPDDPDYMPVMIGIRKAL